MARLELKKQVIAVNDGVIAVNYLTENDFDLSKGNYYKSRLMSNSELTHIQGNDFLRYLYLRNTPIVSNALSFGSLVHGLILEPSEFDNDFIILPNERGFGSVDTKTSQSWLLENRKSVSQVAVTQSDLDTALLIKESFLKSTNRFLDLGSKSVSTELSVDGEVNGLYFKGKIDIVDFDNEILYDIKTTREYPTADWINKLTYSSHYFRQAALYQELFRQQYCTGHWKFKFIFVHNCEEYGVSVGSVNHTNGIERGFEELLCITDKYNGWLRTLNGVTVDDYRKTYRDEVSLDFPRYGIVSA